MKKRLIIGIGGLLLVLIMSLLIVVFFSGSLGLSEVSGRIISRFQSSKCAKAGERYLPLPKSERKECCWGLQRITLCVYYNPDDQNANEEGCVGSGFPCGSVCSDCGNGVCERWEDQCTCAKDCK